MNPSEFIRAKRDGKRLDSNAIEAFVSSYLDGDVADYQMSAFLMAAFLEGLDSEEAAALTEAYVKSGKTIDWSDLPGMPVDKHSTGGVGDKVSLILTPLVAACDGFVPMLSGRGLGHTGGTLDKLESIPGFTTALSIERFKQQVSEIGCAIARQSDELAPADGKIYALRDVTATVESIPLISASIMSKKIAEGAKGLVLDVKVGSGAFMETEERATALAQMLIAIGAAHRQQVRAILTDMSQPLGIAVGNALEAKEAILLMRGEADLPRLRTIVLILTGEMLHIAGIVDSPQEGEAIAARKLQDGSALEQFHKMVRMQDGDTTVCDNIDLWPSAPVIMDIPSPDEGIIKAINTRAIGIAALELGAGRKLSTDRIDPSVGFRITAKIGDKIGRSRPLGQVFARNKDDAQKAIAAVQAAYKFCDEKVVPPNIILKKLVG